jgi:hypothetical protein
VPLYRRQDSDAAASEADRKAANAHSLRDLSAAAVDSFVGIFPEGATHDESYPLDLRYGAARLYCAAKHLAPPGAARPVILPVGLHYDEKHAFRSRALVVFHPPLELPAELEAEPDSSTAGEAHIAGITVHIERALHDVVHATESWKLHLSMERIRKLVRAERAARAGVRLERSEMVEREMGFKRVWVGYNARRESDPEELDRLLAQVRRYDLMMRLLRLEDRDLNSNCRGKMIRRFVRLALKATAAFLLLPSVLVFGYLVNLPTALLLRRLASRLSKSRKEQAGLKVMLGVVLFPLTWLAVGLGIGFARPEFWTAYPWTPQTPILAAAAVMLLCLLSAALALRYHRLAAELLRNLRTLRARSSRFATVERLREMRSKLFDRTIGLAAGLDLPGGVESDGKISR